MIGRKARCAHRGIDIHSEIDDIENDLQRRLILHIAAGNADGQKRLAVSHHQRGRQRCSGTFTRPDRIGMSPPGVVDHQSTAMRNAGMSAGTGVAAEPAGCRDNHISPTISRHAGGCAAFVREGPSAAFEQCFHISRITGAQDFDNLVYAVASRDCPAALKAYATLMEEGVNFIVILRTLQNHFRRLYLVKARMENGEDEEQAVGKVTPPLFFKVLPVFKSQLRTWSLPALDQTLSRLAQLEAQCKQTGMPVETLCAQAILSISKTRAA